MSMADFLASRRIRRWAIGGDAVLKDLASLGAACFFAAAGLHTSAKGFARRCVAPIQAGRLVVALVRKAALKELASPCGTRLLIRLRE
jgi:hypothetical protein